MKLRYRAENQADDQEEARRPDGPEGVSPRRGQEVLGGLWEGLSFREILESLGGFCTSYLSGLTPNPCIDCNRYLKFSGLQKRRRELGAEFVATGHYARKHFDERMGKWQLFRAVDKAKDQSYVLYHLAAVASKKDGRRSSKSLPAQSPFLKRAEQGAHRGDDHADDDDAGQDARVVAEIGVVLHVIAHAR